MACEWRSLSELPVRLQQRVAEADPSQPEAWANASIPALGGRTLFELYDEEGEQAALAFAAKVAAKFS